MRAKFFRTKYFTGSRIQIKYLSLLLVSMIVQSILVGCCLYYLIFTLVAEQIGIPEYIAYNVFPVVNKINVMLIIGIPPLFLLFILWGVILSHRFAGPLERLEKELEEISEDKRHEHRIVLRKNDDIRPIADAINKLLDRMEGRKG
jgi:signal transduction histidine kinase